jgi:hypothetical protein
VDRLLEQVEYRTTTVSAPNSVPDTTNTSTTGTSEVDRRILETIHELVSLQQQQQQQQQQQPEMYNNTANTKFVDALIGYYNVSCTLTTRPNDNPVGGKWTRTRRSSTNTKNSRLNNNNSNNKYNNKRTLWAVRRTLQHILPRRPDGLAAAVAQAINIIRLDLLFGLLPVWIVLRGDVVPLEEDVDTNETSTSTNTNPKQRRSTTHPPVLPGLSSRAVRAYFDPPRIALGRHWTVSFGPTSSVVLDTPYVDDRVRIGKGGTSGTLFVFSRVAEDDMEAIQEWNWLLEQDSSQFVTRRKAAVAVGMYGILSALGSRILSGVGRTVALGNVVISVVGLIWVALGTGGIETQSDTYARGK